MGATMRITWPLLSLSFLFLSICSNTDSQTATSVMKNTVPATSGLSAATTAGSVTRAVPTVIIKTVTVGGISGVPPTGDAVKKIQPTPAPTPAMPAATPTVTATSKLPDKPNSAGPQLPTVTNNPLVPPTMRIDTTGAAATGPAATAATGGAAAATGPAATAAAAATGPAATAVAATAAAATAAAAATGAATGAAATAAAATGAAATAAAAATGAAATGAAATGAAATAAAATAAAAAATAAAAADHSGSAAVTPNAATAQTSKASAPDKTSGTGAPAVLPGNVVTTKITKVSTVGLTLGQQTTIATKTRPDSSGGSRGTASRATEPAGNTGITSTPITLSKAGPTPPPLVTEAGTMPPQTPMATTTRTSSSAAAQLKTFLYSLNNGHEKEEEEKDLVELCKRLMVHLQDGNCTLTWQRHNGKMHFDCVEINGKVKTSLANQYYEDITKKPTDNKTLIAILASCGALLIMIVILAVCASHHRKPYNDNQQHLTEELHTVENGYHDNPTLEVMEVQPEMQEKKMALNGEFNDSWIVPIDNLLKGDLADEEDTHL